MTSGHGRHRPRWRSALVVVLALSFARDCRAASSPDEPQYLLFQLFTAGPGFTMVPDRHLIDALPGPNVLEAQTEAILTAVGTRGDAAHRLGVAIGPFALDHTDAQMRTLTERVFAIAARYRVAVALHVDDSKFWLRRRDLWSNTANVEWLDFRESPNSGQYLNWGGGPWRLAPQACFNSPAMLAEARRIGEFVIGPAVAQGLATLRKTGDEALFAGVIMGWETAIGRDYATRRGLGYCALRQLGYSEYRPAAQPDAALESVVQGWISAWSDALVRGGAPANRIYSHIAFKPKSQFDEAPRGSETYSQSILHSPPVVAFGDNHRPGFSTYPEANLFEEIYAALAMRGNGAWASAEGANVDMQSGPPRVAEQGMESYLAHMFNHGASLVNVFGWGIGGDNPFRRSTEEPTAIAAYQRFLRGAPLSEQPVTSALSPLQSRVRSLPDRIKVYRCAGGDVSAIQPGLARLENHLRDGQIEAMVRELDAVSAIFDAQRLQPTCQSYVRPPEGEPPSRTTTSPTTQPR